MEFNNLYIDGLKLYVGIDVSSSEVFNSAYVDGIELDTLDTFSPLSDDCAYSWENPNKKAVLSEVLLPANFTDSSGEVLTKFGNIVFLKIRTSGIEKASAPCNADKYVYGVAVNWKPIYESGLEYISQLGERCNDASMFSDWFLRFYAFKLAVENGDFVHAYKYYNEWFNGSYVSIKSCNCK